MVKKTHRLRVLIVALASLLVFAIIEARLFTIQIARHEQYALIAGRQQARTVKLNRRRGDIVDRNGQVLATSTLYESIYFNPSRMKKGAPPGLVPTMAGLLDLSEADLASILRKERVTLVRRKAPPVVADALRALQRDLNLPSGAFSYEKASKRLYPQGRFAGPVLGFVGIDKAGDNVGLAGLEYKYDRQLKGEPASQSVRVNGFKTPQRLAPLDERLLDATYGKTLRLTLHSQIQHYAEIALRRRAEELQAKGGVALVMEVKTGAILAMASFPDFDPNRFGSTGEEERKNRAITDPIEIGSVMKILTSAILIDNNLLRPDETIDCQEGIGIVNGRRITDSHALGRVPFREAFAQSSNIGMATVGLRIEPALYYESLRKFGLGRKLNIDLSGEEGGVLRPPGQWTELSRTSLPIGYETSLTALQVVTAVAAIGNGGMRMRPYLVQQILSSEGMVVEEFLPVEVTRVAGSETCQTVLELMEGAVRDGTGTRAQLPGYRIAGKTGTTKKHPGHPDGACRHYIGSFVGLVPASDPQIAVYVYLDEPDPGIAFYGSQTAAPVFAEIVQNAVRILGIEPDAPERRSPHGADRIALANSPDENVDGTAGWDADAPAQRIAAVSGPRAGPGESSSGRLSGRDPGRAPWRGDINREIERGKMPACLGLTMSAVIDMAARAGVSVKLLGTGSAVLQFPTPGTRVEPGQNVIVIFNPPARSRPGIRRFSDSDDGGEERVVKNL